MAARKPVVKLGATEELEDDDPMIGTFVGHHVVSLSLADVDGTRQYVVDPETGCITHRIPA